MKRFIYYNELKNYQRIKLGDFPQPVIGDNEVLVTVKEAFSLSHLDVLVMKGEYTVQVPLQQNKCLERKPMIQPIITEV